VQLLVRLLVVGIVHLVSVKAIVIVIIIHLLIVVHIPGLIHGLIVVVHTGLIVVTTLHPSLHTIVIHVVCIHGLICVVIDRLHRPHRHRAAALVGVHVHLLCAGWHVILCNQFCLFQVDYGVVFELLPLCHFDQVALPCVDECGNFS